MEIIFERCPFPDSLRHCLGTKKKCFVSHLTRSRHAYVNHPHTLMANFDLFRSMYHNHVETSGAFYRPFGPYLDGEPVSISLEAPGMGSHFPGIRKTQKKRKERKTTCKFLGGITCPPAAAAGFVRVHPYTQQRSSLPAATERWPANRRTVAHLMPSVLPSLLHIT